MNPDDVKALIDQLLKTGEILATKAFELSVRQVYTAALLDALWAIFLTIVFVLVVRNFSYWKKQYDDSYSGSAEELTAGIKMLVGGIYSLVSIFLIPCLLTNTIMYSLNPQWYAVKWLLENFIK